MMTLASLIDRCKGKVDPRIGSDGGTQRGVGACRLSCKLASVCAVMSIDHLARMRHLQGFLGSPANGSFCATFHAIS